MSLSRAQRRELNQVSQGLAIGCISLGVQSVSAERTVLEAAIQQAWDRWPHAHKFPALTRGSLRLPEVLSEEMVRQNRRARSVEHVSWRRSPDGLRLSPVRTGPRSAEHDLQHGQEQRVMHWEGLGAVFIKHLGADGVSLRLTAVPPS